MMLRWAAPKGGSFDRALHLRLCDDGFPIEMASYRRMLAFFSIRQGGLGGVVFGTRIVYGGAAHSER